jgi:glutamate racemase
MRIGIFDSGLGGKIIAKAIRKLLPQYDYLYYGDTKNLPYGDKTEDDIYELTKFAVEELFRNDCVLVILACNTASAESLRKLQDTLLVGEWEGRKILGVIVPTVEEIIEGAHERVLLIGTRRTVESGKYEKELRNRNARTVFTAIATPELVPLIEENNLEIAHYYVENVIRVWGSGNLSLVLGCTHYTALTKGLVAAFPHLRIISQDEIIPRKLHSYLERHHEIREKLTVKRNYTEIITGSVT